MKDIQWLEGMHQLDTVAPPVEAQGETIYTLFLSDFLAMPDVNFGEVSLADKSVRSLLN